jgi:HSP20 family protein
MSGRRDPFKEIEELFEQLNSGFADLSGEFEEVGAGGGIHVDVADADDEIVVVADVPGFEPEDIDVSVSDRQLRISAEHSAETEQEDEETHYYRRERTQRAVSRTVTLPTRRRRATRTACSRSSSPRPAARAVSTSKSTDRAITARRFPPFGDGLARLSTCLCPRSASCYPVNLPMRQTASTRSTACSTG